MGLTKKQLEERRGGVGSTDSAAICGLNVFRGAKAVYADKVGVSQPKKDTEAMYWGRSLERAIANRYRKQNQVKVQRNKDIIWHPEYSFVFATPDAFVLDKESGKALRGLELKTAGSARQVERWGPDRARLVPEEYLAQVQWCMLVTGLDRWDIAVLLATYYGLEYREYQVERHEKLIENMLEKVRWFWFECVQKRQEPPFDRTPESRRAIVTLHSQDDGESLAANEEVEEVWDELVAANEWANEAEALKDKLKDYMGDAASLVGPDGSTLATFKTDKRGRRIFRPNYPKEDKYE